MTLPKRPERSESIPNQPFASPEVTSIKGPYWYMALGSGLEADEQGNIQITGGTPSEATAYVYGPGGFVGLGTGVSINQEGDIEL